MSGKKRAWIPDDKEAYIEIEIKELKGDKVIVETKDGRVGDRPSECRRKLGYTWWNVPSGVHRL